MARGQSKNKKPAAEVTLPDGTKIPLGLPPGVPPELAQAVIQQLQANPEVAKKYFEQAKAIAADKEMTKAYMNMHKPPSDHQQKIFQVLSSDPEFKEVFEDIQANGQEAMGKYMEDQELMVKISAKLREAGFGPTQQVPGQAEQGDKEAATPEPREQAGDNLFAAAKAGDVKAAQQLIKGGADVNSKNQKGVTALGLAVGFSQRKIVELLLEHGAEVNGTDGQGNTALHYAAGYGRREIAEVLLRAGADMTAKNSGGHTAADAATMNGEKVMAQFLGARQRVQAKIDQARSGGGVKEEEEQEAPAAAPGNALAGLSEEELSKLSVDEIDAMLSNLSAK